MIDTMMSLNTSTAIYAMSNFIDSSDEHDKDGLWKFFTYKFGKDSAEGTPYSDNMFLNFAHSSVYALLDFIYHIICIPLVSITVFLAILHTEVTNSDNESILERLGYAVASPFYGIIAALALTLALPTRLISSVVSPIVGCAADDLQEPATPTI